MSWSPTQYTQFENERNRPVLDLLSHISGPNVKTAADIGCGPGNSTQLLQAHFPQAEITGVDSSPEMIEAAHERLPGVRFEVADISDWQPSGKFDLILSNAALQWVPDHETLLPKLVSQLTPGGILAVQIPDNLEEPVHQVMRDIGAVGPWAHKLTGASERSAHRQTADWYYSVLQGLGAKVDVWRTTYFHPLEGAKAVVEWFKGTALRPYLLALEPDEQAEFLEWYEAAIAAAYPELPDGKMLLPFPRLFFVATL
ncbi:trans-aconitate 2-methyltransferase [bacterium]|nr:MAG: trans-aconitate 2-methyltransferase [bacterium]